MPSGDNTDVDYSSSNLVLKFASGISSGVENGGGGVCDGRWRLRLERTRVDRNE